MEHPQLPAGFGDAPATWNFAEKIVDSLPFSIFMVDPEHRIVLLNEKTTEIARESKAEILRQGCFGLFCDKKTHFEKCPGHASLYSGESWQGEVDIDGRHYLVSVCPLKFGDVIPYSLVSLYDQTDMVRHRRAMEQLIPRLEFLLETGAKIRDCVAAFTTTNQSSDALFSTVLSTIAELTNATYAFICRFTPDGALVRTHAKVRSPEYDNNYLTQQIRGGIARRFADRTEMLYHLGQEEDHEEHFDSMLRQARSTNVYFAAIVIDGKTWGYLGILSDDDREFGHDDLNVRHDLVHLLEIAVLRAKLNDEIERKEKGLVAAVAEARRAAKAKTMFLATMSHEIRTPLNAIVGFSEILGRTENLPDEAKECATGIARSAGALLGLLNDILDITKIESGAVDMLRGECDLPAVFSEMATVFRYTAIAKGVELRHSVPEGFPRLRLAGPRVRQILLNLIGNAVKFTERGFVEWTASYEPDGEGAVSVAIDVRDTGIGIPSDRLETIFDPFVQDGVMRPDARSSGGTGLGLPIVRRLVKACGGTVGVESEPGKGSTFSIRIGHVETVEPEVPADAPADTVRVPAVLPVEGFVPMLVDDIPLNIDILALHMRSLGIAKTMRAASAAEALAIMRENRPSAVFTDLWMPGMDGAAFARSIRANPAFDGVPVVAVTADNDAAASFDASVFDDMLVKPISTSAVKKSLARILASR